MKIRAFSSSFLHHIDKNTPKQLKFFYIKNINGEHKMKEVVKMNKWMEYLESASEIKYNVAHISSMQELNTNRVAQYVNRCIEIANADMRFLETKYQRLILRTLQWMDVAKCGSDADRELWRKQCPGICLDIHNEASAEIYMHNCDAGDDEWTKQIVYALIKTHGLIGQYIMGETKLKPNRSLNAVDLEEDVLLTILKIVNHAIIAGVSEELWDNIKDDVYDVIERIIRYKFHEDDTLTRLKKLFPAYKNVEQLADEEQSLYSNVFAHVDLWYPTVALQNFARKELFTIFDYMTSYNLANIKHISFYDFSKELAYDRNDKRKENVYKKRIVETLLRGMAEDSADMCEKEHVKIACDVDGNCMKFMVKFTPVCEALINFCVEAERSGFATYQKNIIILFDMFGFRRDIFDRLSNEEVYLETMNNAQTSTKLDILDGVVDGAIVDVGSGGGILLDAIEKKFPYQQVIGTDISANVIEVLEKKIRDEGHRYSVIRHNFVDGALRYPVNNIIFSSIIHEIFSYTEFEGKKFNIDSVKKALKNAADSLAPGGRIIIRDGVMTDSDKIVTVRFKNEDAFVLAKNYIRDFKGLKHLRDEIGNLKVLQMGDDWIMSDINVMRELLYTITWGPMSYSMEVQEQFGYFTLEEFKKALEEAGMQIIKAREFTEPGYPEHLNDKVDLFNFSWNDIPSNCIIVAEKR
jgi:SAM-dependent methyltransferase